MSGVIENCSIGLIAGPVSPATSSPRPRPAPSGLAARPRRPGAARLYLALGRQTSANCGLRLGLSARSTRMTFFTPATVPSRKKTMRSHGLRAEQPVEPPADRAAQDDRGDELAARLKAERHAGAAEAAAGRTRRRGGALARLGGAALQPAFERVEPGAHLALFVLGGLGHRRASLARLRPDDRALARPAGAVNRMGAAAADDVRRRVLQRGRLAACGDRRRPPLDRVRRPRASQAANGRLPGGRMSISAEPTPRGRNGAPGRLAPPGPADRRLGGDGGRLFRRSRRDARRRPGP